jgi:Type II CAAX prenyl endopeptidase Rce1-like
MTAFWAEFAVLYAAALFGGLAFIPYSLRLIEASGRPAKASLLKLAALTFAQNAVLSVVVVAGLLAAHAVGLGAPYVDAAIGLGRAAQPLSSLLHRASVLGGAAGLVLLSVDLVLLPRLPALLEMARKTSLWENFTASFYGGLNEELLTRLLGLSAVAWLLSRLWHTSSGQPTDAVFWSANVIMAVLFGLGHLPAAQAVVGRITPLVLARTLVLNGPIALVCGWLFWRFGIEAAVVAHFVADIVYHVGGTVLLRANDRYRFLPWFPSSAQT